MSGAAKSSILLVEDDVQIRQLLRNVFEPEGFDIAEADNAAQARARLAHQRFDLITLDLQLNTDDGLALARDIRRQTDTPIIIITAKGGEIDRIVGLELGADDYIVKPFNVREVLARVRAVLRRINRPASELAPPPPGLPVYVFDGWRLNPSARELTHADNRPGPVLTSAEFDLLQVFLEFPLHAMSRETLLSKLNGISDPSLDRSIDTLVSRVRKKLEDDPQNPTLIKTVRGIGYMLATPVRRQQAL